jgi:hypothetical protein
MINDSIKVKGNLDIVLKDADGNVKDSRSVRNLLVDDGAEYIASRMITNSGLMSHMAIGEGTTSPAAGNDALENQDGSRVAFDNGFPTRSGAAITYSATFGSGYTGTITEAGIFDAATNGTMLCRTTFNPISKASVDTMQISWTVTITAS